MTALSALPHRGEPDTLADQASTAPAPPPTHLRPVPEGDTAPAESVPEAQPTPSPLDRVRTVAEREFRPPDIWSTDRPALSKLVAYGRHGQQVPDGGVARAAATAWSWFAALNAALGYARAWITERPSRTAVAAALVVLAALIPQTRAVLTVALWPAHTAIDLITDL